MSRILELNNSANFSLAYTTSIPATFITLENGERVYSELTEIIVPIVFDKPILSVNVSTNVPAGRIWRYAGQLSRIISTGIGDSFADEKKALFLGKRNLVLFSEIEADYTVTYLPPSWFRDVTVGIYQYEGTDTSTLETDLARIESKIDALGSPP